MPNQVTSIRIFLASPGDVSSERALIETIVDNWNKRWLRSKNVIFDLLRWETGIVPDFGDDVQDVVNKQTDEFDILIAVFWTKVGTETSRSISGSVEEYERALDRLRNGENIQISFFFKNAAPNLEDIDTEQLNQLREFKKTIPKEGGLYQEFSDDETLRLQIDLLLDRASERFALNKLEPHVKPDKSAQKKSITDPKKSDSASLAVVDDTGEEIGLIDAMEDFESVSIELAEISKNITEKLEEFTEKLESDSKDINELSKFGRPQVAQMKPIIQRSADSMNDFSGFVEELRPNFEDKMTILANKIRVISSLIFDFKPDDDEVSDFQISVAGLIGQMTGASSAMVDLAENAEALPRLSTIFNKARKRFVEECLSLAGDMDKAVRILQQAVDNLPIQYVLSGPPEV